MRISKYLYTLNLKPFSYSSFIFNQKINIKNNHNKDCEVVKFNPAIRNSCYIYTDNDNSEEMLKVMKSLLIDKIQPEIDRMKSIIDLLENGKIEIKSEVE